MVLGRDHRFGRARPVPWRLDLDDADIVRQHGLGSGTVANITNPLVRGTTPNIIVVSTSGRGRRIVLPFGPGRQDRFPSDQEWRRPRD